MGERLRKLLSVKSIITLALTGVFSYLSVTGMVSASEFMTVFTVIISFYFSTQAGRAGPDE